MRPKHLKALPRPVDDPEMWKRLMNHLFGCGEDRLFEWLRDVRRVIEEAERGKPGGRAA